MTLPDMSCLGTPSRKLQLSNTSLLSSACGATYQNATKAPRITNLWAGCMQISRLCTADPRNSQDEHSDNETVDKLVNLVITYLTHCVR